MRSPSTLFSFLSVPIPSGFGRSPSFCCGFHPAYRDSRARVVRGDPHATLSRRARGLGLGPVSCDNSFARWAQMCLSAISCTSSSTRAVDARLRHGVRGDVSVHGARCGRGGGPEVRVSILNRVERLCVVWGANEWRGENERCSGCVHMHASDEYRTCCFDISPIPPSPPPLPNYLVYNSFEGNCAPLPVLSTTRQDVHAKGKR